MLVKYHTKCVFEFEFHCLFYQKSRQTFSINSIFILCPSFESLYGQVTKYVNICRIEGLIQCGLSILTDYQKCQT